MDKEELFLKEYEKVVEDRRFYVGRYLQAATFYFAIAGLGVNAMLTIKSKTVLLALVIISVIISIATIPVVVQFKKLVYHSLDREFFLAEKLGFKKPYPLMWGYYFGLFMVFLIMIAFVILLYVQYQSLSQ